MAKVSTENVTKKIREAETLGKMEDLLAYVMREFGGLSEFAKKIARDFNSAPVGSVARSRLGDAIVRMMQQVAKKEAPTAIEEMTDDELELAVADTVKRVIKKIPLEELVTEEVKNGAPQA